MGIAELVDRHSGDSDTSWICADCGDDFDHEQALNIHQREEHGNENPKRPER